MLTICRSVALIKNLAYYVRGNIEKRLTTRTETKKFSENCRLVRLVIKQRTAVSDIEIELVAGIAPEGAENREGEQIGADINFTWFDNCLQSLNQQIRLLLELESQ